MGFIKFVLKKFKATVINDIWFELVFFTSVAAVVTAVSEFVHPLGISNQLLTVLGTVLGLVVSFRTSSAYDRYWEGRKLWSAIALASRNLAQIIWLHVPNERKGQQGPEARLKAIIEKKSMINLAQAYSVAMKHYLRGEEGIYYEDLYPLVSFLPRYAGLPKPTSVPLPEDENSEGKEELEKGNVDDGILPLWWVSPESTMPKAKKRKNKPRKFNPESALPQVHSDIPLRPARNPPKDTVYDYLPFLIPFKWLIGLVSHRVKERGEERSLTGKRVQPKKVDSNVPLEVVLFLSSYLSWLLANGLLQSPLATAFSNQLQSFQDSLTHLSRVRNTPIPFAYQVHLRMALWMYLFFLPFEVYNAFGWLTIPATTFASFLILGFLEIGQEIENPFSYEPNDLDLDGFCLEIQREIHEVTTHTVLDPSSFIYNELNQPFAPADRRTAEEILEGDHSVGYGHDGADASGTLRQTLVKNWKEVNEVTREVRWKPSTAF